LFHATPQSPQRLIPITLDNQCVASVVALRETNMSSSVVKLSFDANQIKLVGASNK
jgi:hypothetical protein